MSESNTETLSITQLASVTGGAKDKHAKYSPEDIQRAIKQGSECIGMGGGTPPPEDWMQQNRDYLNRTFAARHGS
jgi:hypothetical protein